MKQQIFTILLTLTSLLWLSPASAEDINVFSQNNTSSSNPPNLLVILDNTSNWSSQNQAWSKIAVTAKCNGDTTCLGYVDTIFGSNATLTQGEVEVRALKLVLNELVCNDLNNNSTTPPPNINVGLMLLSPNKGTYSKDSGTPTNNSGVSGIIFKNVELLDSANCNGSNPSSLIGKLNTLNSDIQSATYKAASNANYGGAFYEAFKYFGGYAGPTGAKSGTAGTPVGHIHYGNSTFADPSVNADTEDTNAYSAISPSQNAIDNKNPYYNSPNTVGSVCGGHNFILLVGNTWPNKDANNSGDTSTTNPYSPNHLQSGFFKANSSQFCCINMTGGEWLGDTWTNFIANSDINGTAAGQQNIHTSTINVYNNQPDANQTALLKSMASNGQGSYYQVGGDLGGLISSFQQVLQSILATNTAFASADLPVSVNTQGTFLNQVYIGMFRPSTGTRWPGNLKQYRLAVLNGVLQLVDADGNQAIDPGTGFIDQQARSNWTPTSADTYWAGATWPVGMQNFAPASNDPDGNVVEKGGQAYTLRAQDPANRNVHVLTCSSSCGSLVTFNATNSGLNSNLANWEVGQDTEYANSGDPDSFLAGVTSSNYTSTMRPSVHGDVLHSRPVAVNFGTDANPNVVVFYGANDGMLHAINGNKEGGNAIGGASPGGELWSFVPPEFYNSIASNLNDTAVNLTNVSQPTGKIYGMDGAVNAYFTQAPDPNNAGKLLPPTDAYIYATMRRGGNAVYAFHYTFATPSTPTLAWKIDNTSSGFSGLGETWSTPMVLKTHWTTNPVMLIMGGGYDTCEDDYSSNPSPCRSSTTGNQIYVMDAKTGALLKTFPTDRSVTGDVTVVPDYYLMDGSDTYAYASDLGGNLYRISGVDNTGAPAPFGNTDPSTWVMTKIASLGCDTVTTCTPNRKFMFGPDVVPESGINHILIGSGDREKPLADYTSAYNTTNYFFMVNDKPADSTAWLSSESTNCGSSVICLASLANINAGETPTEKGWYLGLSLHEQVVTSSVTLYGTTTFSTNIPPSLNAASSSECGATYVYNIAYTNAASNNGTGTPYQLVTGGGLPPSPVAGMVNLSAEDSGTGTATTMPFVIGGSPQSPVQAKKGGGSLPTLINQPKRRVYWYIQQ